MNQKNQLLADYVYLADASYTDFSQPGDAYENLKNEDNGAQPESFAKLVTDNYEVIAHYKDRVENTFTFSGVNNLTAKESGFSATLFQSKNNSEYVLAIRGTAGFKDATADLGDLVKNGIAYEQVVDLYNFYTQLITPKTETYRAAVVTLETESDIAKRYKDAIVNLAANPSYSVKEKLDSIIKEVQSKGYLIEGYDLKKIRFVDSGDLYKDEILEEGVEQRAYGLGKLSASDKLVVAGHSLGGHLASTFARLFPDVIKYAYMVNGAGYGSGLDNSIDPEHNINYVFSILNNGNDQGFPQNITNIIGDKAPDVVTIDGIVLKQPGQKVNLFTETAGLSSTFGHGVGQMSDSMAVASLFFAMDSSLNIQDIKAALNFINPIFQAAHSDDEKTLETIVHRLGKLFFGESAPNQANDRNELYQQIINLRAVMVNGEDSGKDDYENGGKYRILSLTDNQAWQATAHQENGADAIAIRYALKNLNPFAVVGVDYDVLNHNPNGELDLYSPENPNGMTETYIQKRAEMLAALLEYNTHNETNKPIDFYHDLESNQQIGQYATAGMWGVYLNEKVLFGTSDDDTGRLIGGEKNDFLFGGAGNDVINGNNGDDYLEGGVDADKLHGGKGFDTYFADLQDTILDSDGSGTVFLGKTKLIGGVQDLTGKEKDLYRNEDGSITYRWNKTTKELRVNNGLIIKDFDNGELGINLVEAKGQDIAFVVDVSGSMGNSINSVVKQLDSLLNMIFSPERGMSDSRISVVAYERPITVLQKFTEHDTVAGRKAAAKQAISKLPHMIAGGTEYLYTALYTVLTGGAGQWRKNAKSRHIYLIGDEPGDDAHLANQVYALAKNLNINASITARSSGEGKFYDVRLKSPDSGDVVSVNIHPIMIGNDAQLSKIFHDIAKQTGGSVHHTQGASDIADVLYDALQSGTGGDDVQIGNEANNTFNGRAGNDKLFGHAGNDTLNGGVGNDVLDGGEGADKFVFNRHFGQDLVYSDMLDTFIFNGISLNNLKFIQTANHDLLIQQQGTQNQITVAGFFDGQSSFAALQDNAGNTLSASQVLDMVQPVPTIDDNQNLKGNIFANHLVGGSGDDVLRSHAGADTLRGGLGNDRLEGGLGADTYLFKAGDGHDRLFDAVGNDTLRFEDVALDRLWFSREGRNLKIDVLDGGGSVTIENQYLNTKSNHLSIHAVEHFQAGKHRLLVSTVKKLLNVMDKFSPVESADLDVDAQKYQYLQDVNIEKYWHNPSEQY